MNNITLMEFEKLLECGKSVTKGSYEIIGDHLIDCVLQVITLIEKQKNYQYEAKLQLLDHQKHLFVYLKRCS